MRRPTARSNLTYGRGLATYHLTCGTLYGHESGMNGTASIALVSPDGNAGTVVALNLRNELDPQLPALVESLVCDRLAV
jgi:hypothetical protein